MKERKSAAPTILLTGFEPFGGEASNPSWQAVQPLHGRVLRGHRVVAACLPTDFRRALPDSAPPGPGSRLFGYYADQRRAIAANDAPLEVFRSARWVWIDTQLLAAWVGALERSGRADEARYLMQRAREFRDPAYGPWLAACRVVEPMQPPSRCLPPERMRRWQDFR